jgi:hypothetical protein
MLWKHSSDSSHTTTGFRNIPHSFLEYACNRLAMAINKRFVVVRDALIMMVLPVMPAEPHL